MTFRNLILNYLVIFRNSKTTAFFCISFAVITIYLSKIDLNRIEHQRFVGIKLSKSAHLVTKQETDYGVIYHYKDNPENIINYSNNLGGVMMDIDDFGWIPSAEYLGISYKFPIKCYLCPSPNKPIGKSKYRAMGNVESGDWIVVIIK